MRILLVKTSSMGDVVHALPVVGDILAAHPGARIEWLVEEAYVPIVAAHPGVSRVIPLALRRWRRSPLRPDTRSEWRALARQLRAAPYDAIIDLQGLVKSAVVARLARGPHFGLSWGSAREVLAPLFYSRRLRTALQRTEAAVPRYRLLAGWALQYQPAGAPRYGLQLPAQHPDWLPDGPYALLLSATAKDRKLWPEADWIGLGAALRAQGLRCVFAWGVAAERERAQRLARGVNAAPAQGYADAPGATQATEASQAPQGPQALAAPQAFGLDAWMRVLRAAEVVVGVDTGLLYLGAAVGTPAVGIYTGSSPHSVDFESAGPWRGVGERGRPPALDEVLAAVVAVRAPAAG